MSVLWGFWNWSVVQNFQSDGYPNLKNLAISYPAKVVQGKFPKMEIMLIRWNKQKTVWQRAWFTEKDVDLRSGGENNLLIGPESPILRWSGQDLICLPRWLLSIH